jgi:ketosteroid isomerase-like protein
VEQTQATMEAYSAALLSGDAYEVFFADDIVVTFVGSGLVMKGSTAAKHAIDTLHHEALEAELEIKHVTIGPGWAAHEAELIGAQTWKVAGTPPSGRRVNIPYSVFYEMANGKITALRVYGLADVLVQQRLARPESWLSQTVALPRLDHEDTTTD